MSNYTRQYATYTAWSLATTILSGILFYAVRVVLFQRLSTEAYAEFYSAMAFVLLLHPFLSLGFDPGLAPHLARWREQGEWGKARGVLLAASVMQLALGMMAWIVLWVCAQWIAPRVAAGASSILIQVLGAYVLAVLLYKIAITALLGFSNIAAKNIAEMARVIICAATIFLTVGLGAQSTQPAIAYIAATFIAGIIGAIALIARNSHARSGFSGPDFRGAVEVMRTGIYATIAFGGVLVFSQLDTVMLNVLRPGDVDAVAAYQVAVPTFMILQSILLALANNFIPVSAALDQRGDHERLGRAISRAYEGGCALVLPAAAIMIPLAQPIIELLFRREVLLAPGALQLLALAAVFVFIAYFNLHALTGLGRTRAAAASIVIALLANIVLNAILIPRWSLNGAAGATLGAYVIATILTTLALRRSIPIRPKLRAGFAIIVTTIASFGCAQLLGGLEIPVFLRLTLAGCMYFMAIGILILAKALPGKGLAVTRYRD